MPKSGRALAIRRMFREKEFMGLDNPGLGTICQSQPGKRIKYLLPESGRKLKPADRLRRTALRTGRNSGSDHRNPAAPSRRSWRHFRELHIVFWARYPRKAFCKKQCVSVEQFVIRGLRAFSRFEVAAILAWTSHARFAEPQQFFMSPESCVKERSIPTRQ